MFFKFIPILICLLCASTISADNSKIAENSVSNELIPSWVNGSVENGFWIGISPPIANKNQARCFALTNAILSYLYASGGANISSDIEYFQSETKEQEYYSFKENSIAILSNIKIDIIKEYYNQRNEYIIACQIKENTNSSTSLSIEKSTFIYSDDDTKYIVRILLHSELGDFKILYQSDNTLIYALNNDNEFTEPQNTYEFKYPYTSLLRINKTADDWFSKRIYNNIGLSLFKLYSSLPLIADTIEVNSIMAEMIEIDNIYTESSANYKGLGKTMPLNFYLSGINENNIIYRIPKPQITESDALENGNMFIGYSNYKIKPFWTSMQVAFYEATELFAHILISHVENTEAKIDLIPNKKSTTIGPPLESSSSITIDNFEINWCIKKQTTNNINPHEITLDSAPCVIINKKDRVLLK